MKYLFVLLVSFSLIGCASNNPPHDTVADANSRRAVARLVMQGSIERMEAMGLALDALNADNTNHANDIQIAEIRRLRESDTKLQQSLLIFSQYVDQGTPYNVTHAGIGECRNDSQERVAFFTHALTQFGERREKNEMTEENYVQATNYVSHLRETDFFLQRVLDGFEREKDTYDNQIAANSQVANNQPSTFWKVLEAAAIVMAMHNANYNSGYVIHHNATVVIYPTTINPLTGSVPSLTDRQGHYYYPSGLGLRDQNGTQYNRNGNIYSPVNR